MTSAEQEQGKYVYGLIRAGKPQTFGPAGIGGRGDEVFTVHFRDLAAVVSSCPLVVFDPTRDNALAHERVNEIVLRDFTVLPMSFGTVFRTDEDIETLLERTYDAFSEVLDRIEGKVEFGLKVNWERSEVIRDLEGEHDEVRRLKEEISSDESSSTYFSRMQMGRVVESALQKKADAYIADIYEELRGVAAASRSNKPVGERMIMNSAFLVSRERMKSFDDRIAEIARKYESKLSFLFTGPWPPYNFVSVRVKLERTDRS
jgi:hypothetical protein